MFNTSSSNNRSTTGGGGNSAAFNLSVDVDDVCDRVEKEFNHMQGERAQVRIECREK